MKKKIKKVKTLLEALPFIKKFFGKTIVIKYGGSAQVEKELQESFAVDLVLLSMVGIRIVVVHGGGKQITQLLEQLQIPTQFEDGVRVTTEESIRVVEMVLSGEINKGIVHNLNLHGAKAIGINGKDMHFIKGRSLKGYTGEITEIDGEFLNRLLREGLIPVIAPIAAGESPNHPGYNINADTAASKVAVAVGAERVLFLTDTPGVLDRNRELIPTLTPREVEQLKREKVIQGGMVPKIEAALYAVGNGVEKAHIIDGRVEHSILLELLTADGVGTQIVKGD
ncbi:MAG: acetylglutamate kinase [Campylobacterales bacterium]